MMAAKSYFRGWLVVWVGNKEGRCGFGGYWVYEDTGERLPATGGKIRPCKECGKTFPLGEGEVDPCLGILPGVDNACCGHGIRKRAYVRFTDGVSIEGFEIRTPPKNGK